MHWLLASGAMIATLVSSPTLAATKPDRTVQIISLIAASENQADPSPEPAFSAGQQGAAPMAAASSFRVHDLTRRWVEFQMTNRLAEPGASAGPPEISPDAPATMTDRISIPGWMRGSAPLPVTMPSYVPGCSIVGYRPTGFLKPDAESRRQSFFPLMSAIACDYGIPIGLFDAMIIQESRYDPVALSPKRAFGLAQLMPGTAAMLGVNRFNVVDNLRGGAKYLRGHLDRFGRYDLALAAYNAGPGRVQNGRVPAIGETQDYVASILNFWQRVATPLQHPEVSMAAGKSPRIRSVTTSTF